MTYTPDGSDIPQEWEFRPGRVRSTRSQMIERHLRKITGEARTWDQFRAGVMQGDSASRRILLWHLLSLEHPTLRVEDVDPMGDELVVEMSKSELEDVRASIAKSSKLDDQTREMMLEALDEQIETAGEDGGKAHSKSSPSGTGQP